MCVETAPEYSDGKLTLFRHQEACRSSVLQLQKLAVVNTAVETIDFEDFGAIMTRQANMRAGSAKRFGSRCAVVRRYIAPAQLAIGAGLLLSVAATHVAVADDAPTGIEKTPLTIPAGKAFTKKVKLYGKEWQLYEPPAAPEGESFHNGLKEALNLQTSTSFVRDPRREYSPVTEILYIFSVEERFVPPLMNVQGLTLFFTRNPEKNEPVRRGDKHPFYTDDQILLSVSVWDMVKNQAITQLPLVTDVTGQYAGILLGKSYEEIEEKYPVIGLKIRYIAVSAANDTKNKVAVAEYQKDASKNSTVALGNKEVEQPHFYPWEALMTLYPEVDGKKSAKEIYDPNFVTVARKAGLLLEGPEWEGRTEYDKFIEITDRFVKSVKCGGHLAEPNLSDIIKNKVTDCRGAAVLSALYTYHGISNYWVHGLPFGGSTTPHGWVAACPKEAPGSITVDHTARHLGDTAEGVIKATLNYNRLYINRRSTVDWNWIDGSFVNGRQIGGPGNIFFIPQYGKQVMANTGFSPSSVLIGEPQEFTRLTR